MESINDIDLSSLDTGQVNLKTPKQPTPEGAYTLSLSTLLYSMGNSGPYATAYFKHVDGAEYEDVRVNFSLSGNFTDNEGNAVAATNISTGIGALLKAAGIEAPAGSVSAETSPTKSGKGQHLILKVNGESVDDALKGGSYRVQLKEKNGRLVIAAIS